MWVEKMDWLGVWVLWTLWRRGLGGWILGLEVGFWIWLWGDLEVEEGDVNE